MTKKEIELIEKDIEDNLKAGECGLASNNEKFQWTNTANAMKKMLEENKQLQERMEYLERSNNRREDIIIEQRQEINNLEDNWNKLKKYIKETKLKEFEKSCGKRYGKTFTQAEIIICNMILDKIQELEKGCDSNVNNG